MMELMLQERTKGETVLALLKRPGGATIDEIVQATAWKPHTVRGCPGPYLELFGRRSAPGWTVWGNEVERDLLLVDS